ncbi:MAG: hypothetical protein K0S71_584 [Clostridia bacterium]|jgi:uncharacterized coiled-coil DUF342 family protein|nr:hypothetical protein [Clostridia bacterium]
MFKFKLWTKDIFKKSDTIINLLKYLVELLDSINQEIQETIDSKKDLIKKISEEATELTKLQSKHDEIKKSINIGGQNGGN